MIPYDLLSVLRIVRFKVLRYVQKEEKRKRTKYFSGEDNELNICQIKKITLLFNWIIVRDCFFTLSELDIFNYVNVRNIFK